MPWRDDSRPDRKPGPWEGAEPEQADGAARPWGVADPAQPPETPVRPPRRQPPLRQEAPGQEAKRRAGPGRRASEPPVRGPDLGELGRQARRKAREVFTGRRSRRALLVGVAAVLVAALGAWALSGLYVVQPGERALEMRFGVLVGETGPGVHYRWPAPVGGVQTFDVTTVQRLELTSDTDADGTDAPLPTADGALVQAAGSVQWRVNDPIRYAFGAADPGSAIRIAAKSALSEAVAKLPMAAALGAHDGVLQQNAVARMQQLLDRWGAGVSIVGLQATFAEPAQASGADGQIAAATREADAASASAVAYRDRVTGDAKADAARLVTMAQGQRDQEVAEAKGEADRFVKVDDAYRKAPAVTRDHLYTEAMERVLHGANKVILDLPKGSGASVVLPPELFRARPAAAPMAGASPAAPASSQPQALPAGTSPPSAGTQP